MGIVTINGNDHQIYDTLDGAKAYLDAHLAAEAWCNGTDAFKSKALVMATRVFAQVNWCGSADDGNPAGIEWPRSGTGVSDDGTTPSAILNGFWELAALIAEDPALPNNSSSGSNVQRAKGGEAEVWFFRSTVDDAPKLPVIVNDWISGYTKSGSIGSLAESFGTDGCDFVSVFDESPDRSEGLN